MTIVFWIYAVSGALNIGIPFHVLCVIVPIVNFFSALPVSIGGFGVREAAYVYLLVPFGLEPSEVVSISLVSVMLQSGLGIVLGGIFFIKGRVA